MKHIWNQPYDPTNRWNGWGIAKISVANHTRLVELDRLEPIVDTTEAQAILSKFTLENGNGN